jgi:U3 small nucleolar RNA-associated protein 14
VPYLMFSAHLQSLLLDSTKLALEDLLAPLASQPSSNLLALKKSTKALGTTKAGALPAPLPVRTQERLDRAAAYERTREEVEKWAPTMRRIKEVSCCRGVRYKS